MEKPVLRKNTSPFHWLKITKKQQLTKNVFSLQLEITDDLKSNFTYEAGQYVTLKYKTIKGEIQQDFSMTSAPFEDGLSLAIKFNASESATFSLFENYHEGDLIEVAEPKGRFTIPQKPSEFRTIIGFAGGIGITPIFSHFKNILHNEPRTRLFLFYGNQNTEQIVFREALDHLAKKHAERFQVFYFLSKEKTDNHLFEGRIDERKLHLIINQILHLDDTDEESTIWDAVDEVLICGKGEMIKTLANACYKNGIPKKNIHFELFEEFNDDIYPIEKEFPKIENIKIDFLLNGKQESATIKDNSSRILQRLLELGYEVPYSCKSGICGSCECRLEAGKVELLENEYLTEAEEKKGNVLACMSVPLSDYIQLNFDQF